MLILVHIFRISCDIRYRIYLTNALDLRVFSIEILLKFWQLVHVPLLLAETLSWIPKLHGWGSTSTTRGPKPWPE